MAYTNSPEFQTYKSVNIPFNGESTYRVGDLTVQRDINIINMYYDRVSQENKERNTNLKKRPGLSDSIYTLNKSASSDTIRGYFYDVDQNGFYWVVGTKVYLVNPDVGSTVRTVATLTTSSGYVGFCSFLKSDNTRYVLFTDGTDLWVDNYVAISCNKVVDPDMPTPHQPFPLYLDGYVFLIKANTGDIYNSDLDDPTSWNVDGHISAEISSDYAIRLFKVKNYIVCLGYNSVEYFWDAANPAPGSPLSRNDSYIRNVGYLSGGCQIGDNVLFVGQDDKQNIGVFMINSFKVERVSNSVIDRTLQVFNSTSNSKGNITLNKDGHMLSIDGHSFYILPTPQTTWVFDVFDKIWYEWKNSDDTGLGVEGVWGMYDGGVYVAITNRSNFALMSQKVYQDFSTNFTCTYSTDSTTFGTFNWKILHRLSLECSKHLSTGTSIATIEYSPDDWSPDGIVGSRDINVFSNSPFTHRLGKFRNISFRIKYSDNYPFFMSSLQLDVNVMGV